MKLDRRKLDLLLAEQTMTYTEMARECGLGYSNLHALLRRKSCLLYTSPSPRDRS